MGQRRVAGMGIRTWGRKPAGGSEDDMLKLREDDTYQKLRCWGRRHRYSLPCSTSIL